jgi:DNA-binding protein HU-beta
MHNRYFIMRYRWARRGQLCQLVKRWIAEQMSSLTSSLTSSITQQWKQANTMANEMVDLMTTLLKNGDRVRLTGLGILEVKNRPARRRNPATGAAIQIAASKKVTFRVTTELKDAI